MSEKQVGDFDEEFITTVNGDYSEIVKQAEADNVQHNALVKTNRTKTYFQSEIPVRPCTADCTHRGTCKDFLTGRVDDGGLCKPELRKIKKWQVAFRRGNLDELKDDVGTVAGTMAVQIIRLLEAVNVDGVVVETTKFVGGQSFKEKMAHPALLAASRLAKDLGIDMSSFLMTPKAAKESGPQVSVNINISAADIQERFKNRYNQEPVEIEGKAVSSDDS